MKIEILQHHLLMSSCEQFEKIAGRKKCLSKYPQFCCQISHGFFKFYLKLSAVRKIVYILTPLKVKGRVKFSSKKLKT